MILRRLFFSSIRQKSGLIMPVLDPPPKSQELPEEDMCQETSSKNLHPTKNQAKTVKSGTFAMLLIYHGSNYYGMQILPSLPSVEGELFKALLKCGLATDEQIRNPKFNIKFNRASRTDAGVSALRQVVSIQLPFSVNIPKVHELLNEHLPSDIRVLGLKRTTRSFDSQLACDARTYCYILPTFAFRHFKDDDDSRERYRIPAETLTTANQVFQTYIGGHCFHNYTEKRDPWDMRSHRVILEASISDAFICSGLEMVELHVKGHSFMLHQIRRMVGMTIAIMRGKAPHHYLKKSLGLQKLPTPTAPPTGLILEKPHYDHYGRAFGRVREPLEWDEYNEEIHSFKFEKILPGIVRAEVEDNSMYTFLNGSLKKHSFHLSENESQGIVKLKNWEDIDIDIADKLLADETIPPNQNCAKK